MAITESLEVSAGKTHPPLQFEHICIPVIRHFRNATEITPLACKKKMRQ